MQRKLLLTSQGIQKDFQEVFLTLLSKQSKDIRVSFVTTAALGEEKNPQWLTIYRDQLKSLGISNIEDLDIRGKTYELLQNILCEKDIIFMNGGNSFYLLKWIKESSFDNLLPRLLNKGVIYVGVSAGSYICCPTIEQSTWKHQDRNKVGLKDFSALNLVPFLISAHYEEKYKTIIEQAAKTTKYPIVTLNDAQAVLVIDNAYEIVGKGNSIFLNGYKNC